MNTQVEILVNGKPVKQHYHNGRTYVEARKDTQYTIKIRNNDYRRKMAVVTVDGVNVISGEPQNDNVGQGYIVNSRDTLEVKGFRKDLDTVGRFKFCQKGKSYCNEVGLKGNNGVIGVRIYNQKEIPFNYKITSKRPIDWTYTSDSGTATPLRADPLFIRSTSGSEYSGNVVCSSLTSDSPNFDMGSTWGDKITDSVVQVSFDPDLKDYSETVIYYDSRGNLKNLGIQFNTPKQVHFPKAFGGFAKPPKGWDN